MGANRGLVIKRAFPAECQIYDHNMYIRRWWLFYLYEIFNSGFIYRGEGGFGAAWATASKPQTKSSNISAIVSMSNHYRRSNKLVASSRSFLTKVVLSIRYM